MIIQAIKSLRSNHPRFKVVGDETYDNIFILIDGKYQNINECSVSQKKDMPTKAELDAAMEVAKTEFITKTIDDKRVRRYNLESDNLFMEYQYELNIGKRTQQELDAMKQLWLDKVSEIKRRIPK